MLLFSVIYICILLIVFFVGGEATLKEEFLPESASDR